LKAPRCNRFLCKKNEFEFIWTVAPIIILLLIAFPSIQLLYERREVKNPLLTIKATGYQWFWGYEYSDNRIIEFDSYIIKDDCLVFSEFRNLEVDNRVVIPINTDVRLLTTGADVIHSWAVPSLGVKIDSVPGRINGIPLFSRRPAVYYGQCSEICGAYHAFMPIVVETVPVEVFEGWVYKHINRE
jgi:cytochrome c oxidase subunit 2